MFHQRLTWFCDIIILIACCLAALQACFAGMNWIWGLTLLNCVAVIALRHWLMQSLQIPWLTSVLNRMLKRAADIVVALLFLLTAFPAIILIQTIIIKSSKRTTKALFTTAQVQLGDDKHFSSLIFQGYSRQGLSSLICPTPLVLNLLAGTISLSDLPLLTITPTEPEETAEESTQETAEENTAPEDTPQETPLESSEETAEEPTETEEPTQETTQPETTASSNTYNNNIISN